MSSDASTAPRLNAVTPLPPARGRPLQVLQVLGNAIVGGMESWVLRLVQRLPRERFAFTVLCPFESRLTEQLQAAGAVVETAPMPDDLPWATLQAACALVQQQGIELLHAHLPQAHLLAGLVGSLTRTPVLTTLHARQLSPLDLEVHRLARSHISVVARQSYFHALGLGVEPTLLSCEPNGVDTTAFRPRERTAGEPLRQRLGLAPDVPLVGCVGRLSPEKGPEVFVRAALMLRMRHPGLDAHAVLVGEGPMQDDLHRLIARYGLEGRVHLAGVCHDMPTLYGELDAVACCSHTEAMPLALMEAMACGLPTVATYVGGVPDIVEHGHTGWLAGAGDFDDIGRCCGLLLTDAALRRHMGERARARAVQRLDLATGLTRVGALMERLARPVEGRAAAQGHG
ncbi:glycosyltransferase [Roseateles cellulosilyticus]|uniref:Glycosyltransferase n=1 Tax=Pelomonas cellulosilytica TaxID=2906762 RepID=A0ABS8XMZ2_9BURK|nr:glycosyltransferase [Pelomonas sp. P8]MCE4553115.1 glycosyltransferase [Pelomonas sp. P8]